MAIFSIRTSTRQSEAGRFRVDRHGPPGQFRIGLGQSPRMRWNQTSTLTLPVCFGRPCQGHRRLGQVPLREQCAIFRPQIGRAAAGVGVVVVAAVAAAVVRDRVA